MRLPQYNNVLKRRYHKVGTIPKTLFFCKGCLARCVSCFIRLSKLIRYKYPNRPKTHTLENLVLIAEDENKIRKNSGVSNVYMFLHANFKGAGFYSKRPYVHLINEVREEYIFVSDENEEDNEVLPVSELPFLV